MNDNWDGVDRRLLANMWSFGGEKHGVILSRIVIAAVLESQKDMHCLRFHLSF